MIEKAKILIVEDEVILSMDIAMRLATLGYQVLPPCTKASQALTLLEENRPDILILDIDLGAHSIDGIDLAHQANRLYGLPFIFLTSHTEDAIVNRAKATQPSAYLLKPFNDNAIKVSIEVALANFSGTPRTQEPVALPIKDSLFFA